MKSTFKPSHEHLMCSRAEFMHHRAERDCSPPPWWRVLAVGLALGLSACSSDDSGTAALPATQGGGMPEPSTPQPADTGMVSPPPATTEMGSGAPAPAEDLIVDDGDGASGLEGGFLPSERVDLLFVIDNSSSMADKQAIFKAAIPDLISQMVNPPCKLREDAGGGFAEYDPIEGCRGVGARLFDPVKDIHIAVVSSSLGPSGTQDSEIPLGCEDVAEENDRAWALGRIRPELAEASYQGWGFLVWDQDGQAMPPGDTDLPTLIQKFQTQVDTVGELGCGFEAPLEAAYRFLSEPDPHESLQRVPCPGSASMEPLCVEPVGMDMDLLAQRQQFLRPDSVVVVMYLTDENDCSVRASGQGYLALSNTRLRGATNACDSDPNSECCRPCGAELAASCDADPATNGCADNMADAYEARSLRCFDQQRRFGVNFLRSTDVYVGGFTNPLVADRNGMGQPNALFTDDRGRDKIFVVGIVGVPWQDTSDPEQETANNFDLIEAKSVDWARFLPTDGNQPTDPFNIEAMAMRSGTHPITGETLGGPGTWNSINGHDRELLANDGVADDLQYSCIFELPEPRNCTGLDLVACDCVTEVDPETGEEVNYYEGNPLCYDAETGTYDQVQRYAKAYPAPRMLQVLKGVSCPPEASECTDQSVVASICPRQLTDPSAPDYGYRPVVRALLLNLVVGRSK